MGEVKEPSVHVEGPIAMSARFEERGQMADLTGSGRAIITKDYEYSE